MSKIRELQQILKKKGIDFAIFCNIDFERFDHDMAYFSGYSNIGVLIIPKNKKPFLVVPKIEAKKIKQRGIKVYSPKKGKKLLESIKEKIKQNKIKNRKIGMNKEALTLLLKDAIKKNFKKSILIDLRKELYNLREQKTKEEIKIIKKGCRISDEILKKCFKIFKKFKTEAEVKAFLEYEAKKKGCELAFPTIVASGKNSSEVHHQTQDIKLKNGFCVIDFGIRYKNYCSDTTRTIYIGKPSKNEIEIYNLLLDTQKEIIKKIELNEKCSELFKEVSKNLGKYGKYFTHGLGHGLGIKIHELPNLTEKSKDKIKENTVFTIEPGIYFKNYGIRIEDSVLAAKNKIEILTKLPKNLLTIDLKK